MLLVRCGLGWGKRIVRLLKIGSIFFFQLFLSKNRIRKLENENNNMYRIISIVDGLYIVQTPKGVKKVKVIKSNKKDVRDEIKIEKL